MVALGVALALVPVLYGLHLAIVEEKVRHLRATHVAAVPLETATSCPSCGEPVNVAQMQFETLSSEEFSVAS